MPRHVLFVLPTLLAVAVSCQRPEVSPQNTRAEGSAGDSLAARPVVGDSLAARDSAPPARDSTAMATLPAESGEGSSVEGRLEEGDSAIGHGFEDFFAYTPSRTGSVTFHLVSNDGNYGMTLTLEDANGAQIARGEEEEGEAWGTVDVVAGRRYVLRVGGPWGRYRLSVQTNVTPP